MAFHDLVLPEDLENTGLLRNEAPADGHVLHRCTEPDCPVCRGGDINLSLCETCGGAEASMPNLCPGRRLTAVEEEAITNQTLAFTRIDGEIVAVGINAVGRLVRARPGQPFDPETALASPDFEPPAQEMGFNTIQAADVPPKARRAVKVAGNKQGDLAVVFEDNTVNVRLFNGHWGVDPTTADLVTPASAIHIHWWGDTLGLTGGMDAELTRRTIDRVAAEPAPRLAGGWKDDKVVLSILQKEDGPEQGWFYLFQQLNTVAPEPIDNAVGPFATPREAEIAAAREKDWWEKTLAHEADQRGPANTQRRPRP